jgi:hypothetical protein
MKKSLSLAMVSALWMLAALPTAWGADAAPAGAASADGVIRPASERFAAEGSTAEGSEVPHFRRHVVALAGRLGCNGRACHGSFQGKGDFRLSLFGYDFAEDHKNMLAGDSMDGVPRANVKDPAASLVLRKPTLQVEHEGGERMKAGSWQYNVLLKWIKSGAANLPRNDAEFAALEVTPKEILFQKPGQTVQLKAVARWADGTREDVTCLCRFKTNNEQVAKIDEDGKVTAGEAGDTHVVVFYDNGVQPIPVIRPVSQQVGDKYPQVPTPTKIDELVIAKLRKLGMVPSDVSADAEFLRRVSLDMTGTLPTAKEVEAFLADKSPDKRARKIDELLQRPAYAAWWATRLCDITGNNDQQLNNVTPIQGSASREWYEWIRQRVADNMPYDELAAGIILGKSRNDGESYTQYAEKMSKLYGPKPDGSYADRQYMPHYWARLNFRTPEDRAIGFAYSFMGTRIQCAQCHKHPFDQWTKQDFDNFKGFFSSVVAGRGQGVSPESRQEYQEIASKAGLDMRGNNNQVRGQIQTLLREGKTIPFPEVYAARTTSPRAKQAKQPNRKQQPVRVPTAKLLGGETIDLTKHDDVRKPLMAWLRSKDNPYFARSFVNRVWAGYFNVGIVQPPDDMSLANPPSNGPLLDYLTQQFIAHKFDMKWLHREIALSRTYQLGWQPNETNKLDETNFSRCVPRRLPAEVAIDAIAQATAADSVAEKMSQEVAGRSIAIPGTGNRNQRGAGTNYALTIFGRSTRESNCDCDRSMEASLLQTVYLQNDQELLSRIDSGGWLRQITRGPSADRTAPAPKRGAVNERQIARVREQIEAARKAGDTERAAELQRRLAAVTRGGGAATDRPAVQEVNKSIDAAAVVKQAFLRTLSRYPSDQELARCRKEIEQASDTATGIRDVLWALLNTKEFIVNH